MSSELKSWLHSRGVATSRTTPYNPQGNGQVERYNGVIWKTISLALRTQNLPVQNWELVLFDALHSIRTLISTATNETPHERFFSFKRRSPTGNTLPSWLSNPGKVLRKRHVRQSKYEPLVEEVDLIEANPNYAYIQDSAGRETSVSLRDLAPRGNIELEILLDEGTQDSLTTDAVAMDFNDIDLSVPAQEIDTVPEVVVPELGSGKRVRNEPKRLGEWVK